MDEQGRWFARLKQAMTPEPRQTIDRNAPVDSIVNPLDPESHGYYPPSMHPLDVIKGVFSGAPGYGDALFQSQTAPVAMAKNLVRAIKTTAPVTLHDMTIPGVHSNKMFAAYRGDQPLAYISGGPLPKDPKTFHIGDVTSAIGEGPNDLGASTVKQILRAIRETFPDIERIGGYRVSGARDAAGATEDVYVNLD